MNFKQLAILCESANEIDWERFVNDELRPVKYGDLFKQWFREMKFMDMFTHLKYVDGYELSLPLSTRLERGKMRLAHEYHYFLNEGEDWIRKHKQKPFLQSNEHGMDLTF